MKNNFLFFSLIGGQKNPLNACSSLVPEIFVYCLFFEFVYLAVYMMLIPKILKLIKESLLCFLVYIFSSIDMYGTISHTRSRENPFSVI